MNKNKREEYEQQIVGHANYTFIPTSLKLNWVMVSKKGINPRKEFWENELQQRVEKGELTKTSKFHNLARLLHPTKKHICKGCNQEVSIYYVYPTKATQQWLKQIFKLESISANETIFDIYKRISDTTKSEIFQKYFGKTIECLEADCFSDTYDGKKLSPGVMSNPPDRLDGFHCLSICCRKTKDKGRSDENMKSYTRDRRSYEMFSDGNILLANALMGKLNTVKTVCYSCNKTDIMTGDHIGPISLGFIHDPKNLQACCGPCNSRKNNRLQQSDIEKLQKMEHKTISWWAEDCWNKHKNAPMLQTIQREMDKNAKKFLEIISWLKKNKYALFEEFIQKTYAFDNKSYSIQTIAVDTTSGKIEFKNSEKVSEKKTKQTQQKRIKEILLEVTEKQNRKTKIVLTEEQINKLSNITFDTFQSTICTILKE